jgi:hypothetical protein
MNPTNDRIAVLVDFIRVCWQKNHLMTALSIGTVYALVGLLVYGLVT